MKTLLKRAAARIAPEATTAILSARARAHSHRLVEEWGLSTLNEKLIATFGPEVRGGPFQGMHLSPMAWKEHLGPYLLGTYEAELHPWFVRILDQPFEAVIDVGAKFGYYAVGLARRLPDVDVVAFDTDPWARRATRQMARANGVDGKVRIEGFCNPERLASLLNRPTLVISDCEGYEHVLFGRTPIPSLESSTLIIELHEELSPGVSAAITRVLERSHTIEYTSTLSAPERAVPPGLGFLQPDDVQRAIHEARPPQVWLLAHPRS